MGQFLTAIIAIAKILSLVLRWLEHRGKVNEARKAVAADLQLIARKFQMGADTARANLNHSADSVRDDPDNRDNIS